MICSAMETFILVTEERAQFTNSKYDFRDHLPVIVSDYLVCWGTWVNSSSQSPLFKAVILWNQRNLPFLSGFFLFGTCP